MSLTADTTFRLDSTYVTGIDPVYNPINYILSSDSNANINFKYVMNLYDTDITGSLLSTIRLSPRPNGSCHYNPARVLESICSQDLGIQNISTATGSTNEFKPYRIQTEETFGGLIGQNTFRFTDNQYCFDTAFLGKVGFVVFGFVPFTTGDTINVLQDADAVFSGYNGNHNVVLLTPAIGGGTLVVVDWSFSGSTVVNGGYLDYSSGSTSWNIAGPSHSAYTFNGVLQYVDYPSWSPTPYTQTTGKLFLTNQPRSGVNVKNLTDRATLSFIHYPTTGSTSINITRTYLDGSIVSQGHLMALPTSAKNICHIPSGPYNLNLLLGSNYIDVTTLESYTLFVDLSGASTESITYLIDQRCSKYNTVRLQFLNGLGGWDYVNFDMVSRTTVNLTKRESYKKNLPLGYQVGDRQKTLIDIDGNYIYTLTSNWMNDAQSLWIEELFTSQDVRIINSDGTSLPVNIQENTLEIQKTINQKMISYTFNLESASSINGGRG